MSCWAAPLTSDGPPTQDTNTWSVSPTLPACWARPRAPSPASAPPTRATTNPDLPRRARTQRHHHEPQADEADPGARDPHRGRERRSAVDVDPHAGAAALHLGRDLVEPHPELAHLGDLDIALDRRGAGPRPRPRAGSDPNGTSTDTRRKSVPALVEATTVTTSSGPTCRASSGSLELLRRDAVDRRLAARVLGAGGGSQRPEQQWAQAEGCPGARRDAHRADGPTAASRWRHPTPRRRGDGGATATADGGPVRRRRRPP